MILVLFRSIGGVEHAERMERFENRDFLSK